jgi:hypothetical protein
VIVLTHKAMRPTHVDWVMRCTEKKVLRLPVDEPLKSRRVLPDRDPSYRLA